MSVFQWDFCVAKEYVLKYEIDYQIYHNLIIGNNPSYKRITPLNQLTLIGEENMPRFFVEVPHEPTKEACDRAIQQFLETGSHFMTNADWGCDDGEHKAWFTLEIEDKESVLQILPPVFRQSAKIVALRKFTINDIPQLRDQHGI